jgi:hypothetical protein
VIDGLLDVTARGFRAPSGGPGGGTEAWDGGGHGGEGGAQSGLPTGASYGALTRPSALGNGSTYSGGDGGGAVTLDVTNTLTLNGRVLADGGAHPNYGGGSGGSVWLIADAFAGTGVVSSAGGHGNLSGSHAGGGGGRVAIDCVANAFSGVVELAGGPSLSSAVQPEAGTLFRCAGPYRGAVARGRHGVRLDTSLDPGHGSNGVHLTRTILRWGWSIEWDESVAEWRTGEPTPQTATYTLTGVAPDTAFQVYVDGRLDPGASTNSDMAGLLSFDLPLTNPTQTILVRPLAGGTTVILR